jgi:hypothetical protein
MFHRVPSLQEDIATAQRPRLYLFVIDLLYVYCSMVWESCLPATAPAGIHALCTFEFCFLCLKDHEDSAGPCMMCPAKNYTHSIARYSLKPFIMLTAKSLDHNCILNNRNSQFMVQKEKLPLFSGNRSVLKVILRLTRRSSVRW